MKYTYLVVFLVFLFFSESMPAVGATGKKLNWMGHWKGEGKRQLLVEEVKSEFEFLNPDVKVNLVYDVDLQAPGEYYKWRVAHIIAQMIQTGKIEWDVVFLGVTVYNYVAEILDNPEWGREHLVDFSSVEGFFESQKAFTVNTPYYKNQTGGIFVGPFIEGFISCLWYNRAVAERVGISVAEEGMTTTDFLDYAKQLSAYNKDNAHQEKTPFFNLCSLNRVEALFEHIFKSFFKDKQHVIELSYSREKADAFYETLLFFEQLSHHQPILNKGWRTADFVQYQKDFLAGSGLFIPAGTWMYGHFEGNAPANMTNGVPIEPPIAKHQNGLVGQYSNVWAVMKNSPNRENGIELLKSWARPKIAEKWIIYTKNPTGLKGHLSTLSVISDSTDVYSDFVNKMTRKYKDVPMRNYRSPVYVFGPSCKVTGKEFRENLGTILEGKKTAKSYFHEVMKRHGKSLP